MLVHLGIGSLQMTKYWGMHWGVPLTQYDCVHIGGDLDADTQGEDHVEVEAETRWCFSIHGVPRTTDPPELESGT